MLNWNSYIQTELDIYLKKEISSYALNFNNMEQ